MSEHRETPNTHALDSNLDYPDKPGKAPRQPLEPRKANWAYVLFDREETAKKWIDRYDAWRANRRQRALQKEGSIESIPTETVISQQELQNLKPVADLTRNPTPERTQPREFAPRTESAIDLAYLAIKESTQELTALQSPTVELPIEPKHADTDPYQAKHAAEYKGRHAAHN